MPSKTTLSILHAIHSPKISPTDEGSPMMKHDDLPKEPLVSSPLEFYIDENMRLIVSALKSTSRQRKKAISEVHHSKPPSKQKIGWSQEEINQALRKASDFKP